MQNPIYFAVVTVFLLANLAGCSYLSCNFDDDFCDYIPNQFVVRHTGPSPSVSSGPNADHTTGEEGYYALCDARLLRNPDDRCTLKKDVQVSETSQLSFWYYMFGTQVGTLELLVDDQTVWSLTGQQDKSWLRAQVELEEGSHTIEFRASRSPEGRVSADLAIDDIAIESEQITTKLTTVTRTSPRPLTLTGCEFDLNMCGWQTNYVFNRWYQTNGNMSSYFDMLGPASDWTSIASSVLNNQNQPLNTFCAIPYCIAEDSGTISTNYYCKKHFLRNRPACGRQSCPLTMDNSQLDICNLGNYLFISNDKFSTPMASSRSSLFSPVYQPRVGIQSYCLRYKYNIVTEHPDDGFTIFIEDYYSAQYVKLTTKMGKLSIDRWHSESILIKNINSFSSFRFVIQPFRENQNVPIEDFASVSIDSVVFAENNCPNDEDSSLEVDLWDFTTTTTSTSTTTTTTTTTTTSTTTTTTPTTITTSTAIPETESTEGSPEPGTTPQHSTSEPESSPSVGSISVSDTPSTSSDSPVSTTRSETTRTSSRTTATTPRSSTSRTTTTRTSTTPQATTTTLKTMTMTKFEEPQTPKKKGTSIYVNIFVPIASVAVFCLVVVGVYVLAKKKGFTLRRSRSVESNNDNLGRANARSTTNDMELGNNRN